MSMFRSARQGGRGRQQLAVFAASVVALLASVLTTPANAQLLWGGKNTVYDKTQVSFPAKYRAGEIIVSFGDRRLYHVVRPGTAMSYPIAVPRERSRWDGVLRVTRKAENPTWTPTPLMRRENPKLPAYVPGGHPRNPLGVRALYLGSTMYRIHGTDAPWTIGKNVSKGCVRMHNEHVLELYPSVRVGAKVTATWKKYAPVTVATAAPGSNAGKARRAFFSNQR
ncbi:MAG: L,D-transpeptidase [Pseudomonadota bacterium]